MQENTTSGNQNTQQGKVVLETSGSIAFIRLGAEGEKVVILTKERMASLRAAIQAVKNNSNIKGLIIIGIGPTIFCAGADINIIRGIEDKNLAEELAKQGQDIFTELASLSCTTVAAISGACVGGGCELVLACDYRIAADIKETRIGLPEIRLGILPGWGGTQRLPRLVGVTKALDIILKGKVVPAAKAREIGLLDLLVPIDTKSSGYDNVLSTLETVAADIVLGKTRVPPRRIGMMDRVLTHTGFGQNLTYKKAKEGVKKTTKGQYPAPPKALDAVFEGLRAGEERGFELERRGFGELVVTSESKSLVHLFFLSEDSSKMGRSAKGEVDKARVAIIGGGVMGAGIAASFLSRGTYVVVVELNEQARIKARNQVEAILSKQPNLSEKKRAENLNRLAITDKLIEIKEATCVVEAIVEDLEVKRKLFRDIAALVSDKTILATNTSSLSVSDISEGVPGQDRIIGMHFFNPVEKMPLVEIVRGKQTGERAIAYTAALSTALGKYPVVVDDVHGFLVNRILSPYLMEAGHLLAEGVSPELIDAAATSYGMPMGPVRLLDEIGLDVASKVAHVMEEAYGARMAGPSFSSELVAQGRLGRKSGAGFYRYQGNNPVVDNELQTLLGIVVPEGAVSPDIQEVQDRLMLSLLNEAVRCFDEGVAGAPGKEAAGQVDLSTVMGIGFPAFKGGIFFDAQRRGVKAIYDRLTQLKNKCGDRFTPADGILRRVQEGKGFYDSI